MTAPAPGTAPQAGTALQPGTAPAPAAGRRLSYIDWMRGLAILIMIEAHVTDAWTRPTNRRTLAFGCATILAGFAAPMFLFLAGLSASIAAGSRTRRLGDAAAAAASVRRRGWQVFGLAYLFRLQAYLLNPKAMLAGVLKVDILNVMGPSIVAAAALWQAGRGFRRRLILFGAATLAVALVTPIVRTAPLIGYLPDVLEWYVRPVPGRNNFTLFPWAGFAFAGALVGVLVDRRRDAAGERRFHARMGGLALVLAAAATRARTSRRSIPTRSSGRARRCSSSSAPASSLRRSRPSSSGSSGRACRTAWSPMTVFGQSSLFVYWVHVELVYGAASGPLHQNLSFRTAACVRRLQREHVRAGRREEPPGRRVEAAARGHEDRIEWRLTPRADRSSSPWISPASARAACSSWHAAGPRIP